MSLIWIIPIYIYGHVIDMDYTYIWHVIDLAYLYMDMSLCHIIAS